MIEKMKKAKKKNPQDLTLRNLRALKEKIKLLSGRVDLLQARVSILDAQVTKNRYLDIP